jgi:hypothetical protein
VDRDPVAQLGEPAMVDFGSEATGDHVEQQRRVDLGRDLLDLLDALRRFDEDHVGPDRGVPSRAADRLADPQWGPRVSAGDDHRVRVTAGFDRCL